MAVPCPAVQWCVSTGTALIRLVLNIKEEFTVVMSIKDEVYFYKLNYWDKKRYFWA